MRTPDGTDAGGGLGVVALAQLMVVLDTTVVTIALPSAQRSIGLSDGGRQWVVTAYTLAFGGLLLLGGRLGDLLGRRRTLLAGVTGFAVASMLGGLATGPAMLIGARAAQGAFAALFAPSALALLTTVFNDPRERARAFAMFSVTLMAGGACGQILGGALTEYLGWRWCLYVNVPIAAAVVVGAVTVLPATPGHAGVRLDLPGAILGCGGMTALIYALGEAGSYGWASTPIIGLLVTAVVLLAAFVVVQAKVSDPLLPLRVLADRNRVGAFLAVATATFGMLGMFLFMTFHLQTVLHYSSLRTGLAFLPYVAAAITATQVSRRLLSRVRPRTIIAPGLVLASAGLTVLTRLSPHSPYAASVLPALLLCGLGMGSLFAPSMSTATSTGDPRDAGIASAVVNTAQQIGGSIGTALLNTIAAGAASVYLTAHRDAPSALAQATVHGNAVACAWAAGILLAMAVLVAVLITTRPGQPTSDEPAPRPRAVDEDNTAGKARRA
ncbi:MFS transporter [Actinomadura rupiterrae]|uniref:MFS transporter n=1 Tax=Actinomadura rupiterrae TaxID=559627 RepID=UPI0020A30433|nr:MFS transporter [Actinomadura rupiterrae]MCP2342164.1 EmrB/QacA subfamily drug resistance transporter [Actinomadura rupiterrae]